jgi:hypothetical protein
MDVTFLEKEPFYSFKGNDGSNVDVEGETSTNSNSKCPIFIHLQDKIQSEATTQGEDISGTNDDDQVHNLPPLSQVIENEGFIEDTCPSNNVSPARLFDPDDIPRVKTSTEGSSLPSETTSDMMEETGTHNLTSPSIDQPIALRKARRHMDVPSRLKDRVGYKHDIAKVVNYERCSAILKSFLASLDNISVPKKWKEAIDDSKWKSSMLEEMDALEKNNTWELVNLPPGKELVGCKWVYTVKHNPDGKVERYKARLVAKGYTQTYGIDYEETFATVLR